MQKNTEQKAQTKHRTTDKGYTQLTNQYTTDYHTQIDHVYTICATMCTISKYPGVLLSGSARVFGYSVFKGVLNRVYGILQLKYGYSVYYFL